MAIQICPQPSMNPGLVCVGRRQMKKQVVGSKHPTFRFVQLAVGSPKNLPGCWGILVWCTNSVFIKCKQVLDLTLDIATDCVADEYPHDVFICIHRCSHPVPVL